MWKEVDLDTEGNDIHREQEAAGLFPPSKAKVDSNNYDEFQGIQCQIID